jgi:hypothetical protein
MPDSKRPRAPRAPKDIAILNGPTEDGQGARVVRIREGEVSAGEIRPVREGEPINQHEIVRLRPLDAQQRVCEIEVLHAPGADAAALNKGEGKDSSDESAAAPGDTRRKRNDTPGPVRVSNPTYRKNWSTIFEPKKSRRGKPDWSLN